MQSYNREHYAFMCEVAIGTRVELAGHVDYRSDRWKQVKVPFRRLSSFLALTPQSVCGLYQDSPHDFAAFRTFACAFLTSNRA